MKRFSGILLVLLVIAALSISGCTTPTPTTKTPTTTPTTVAPTTTPGTPTSVAPTTQPTSGGVLSTVGQLFNINSLNWYQFRMTMVKDGKTTTATYKISMLGDTTYNGVAAKHDKFAIDMPAQDGQEAMSMEVDTYTSKADQSSLGGHLKMIQNGQTLMEMDIPASQSSSYSSTDITSQADAQNDVALTNAGPDVVIIDGKTYACTKYTYTTTEGAGYTVWYSPQAPMPVKTVWTGDGTTSTMELIGWG